MAEALEHVGPPVDAYFETELIQTLSIAAVRFFENLRRKVVDLEGSQISQAQFAYLTALINFLNSTLSLSRSFDRCCQVSINNFGDAYRETLKALGSVDSENERDQFFSFVFCFCSEYDICSERGLDREIIPGIQEYFTVTNELSRWAKRNYFLRYIGFRLRFFAVSFMTLSSAKSYLSGSESKPLATCKQAGTNLSQQLRKSGIPNWTVAKRHMQNLSISDAKMALRRAWMSCARGLWTCVKKRKMSF